MRSLAHAVVVPAFVSVAAGVVAAVDAAFVPGAPEGFAAAAASAVVAGVLPAFPAALGAVLVADVTVPASAAAGPAIVELAAPRPGIRRPGIHTPGRSPSSSSSYGPWGCSDLTSMLISIRNSS